MCVVNRVGVRELRQNLSVYLRRVTGGETLEVTEHGRPVAILAPLSDAAPLARLVLAGRVRAANSATATLPAPLAPVAMSGTAALDEQRDGDL